MDYLSPTGNTDDLEADGVCLTQDPPVVLTEVAADSLERGRTARAYWREASFLSKVSTEYMPELMAAIVVLPVAYLLPWSTLTLSLASLIGLGPGLMAYVKHQKIGYSSRAEDFVHTGFAIADLQDRYEELGRYCAPNSPFDRGQCIAIWNQLSREFSGIENWPLENTGLGLISRLLGNADWSATRRLLGLPPACSQHPNREGPLILLPRE